MHATSPICRASKRRPSLHRIPRAEDKVPRKGSGRGAVARSMRKGKQWGAVGVQKNPGATGSGGDAVIFPGGMPGESADFNPHQQAQARLSTEARGLGLPSTEARRTPASMDSSRPHGPDRRPSDEDCPSVEHHCSARRQFAGDSRYVGGNKGSDGRNRSRILIGMGSTVGLERDLT